MNTVNKIRKPRRVINGVLLLNKPRGISSTQALGRAKWLIGAEKAGHTGTLDPLADGLLPLCFGHATKLAHDLLDADKTYVAGIVLGQSTSTGDMEGDVIFSSDAVITEQQWHDILPQFARLQLRHRAVNARAYLVWRGRRRNKQRLGHGQG